MLIKTGIRKTAGMISVIAATAALGALATPAHAASSASVCSSRITTANSLNSSAIKADEPRADPAAAAVYNIKTQKEIKNAVSDCRNESDARAIKTYLDSATQHAKRAEVANKASKVTDAQAAQTSVKSDLGKALAAA